MLFVDTKVNINEMFDTFKSKSKVVEIILLLSKAKLCVRSTFYPEEQQKVIDFCNKYKIYYEISDFKIELDNKNYSNLAIQSENGVNFFYFSLDIEFAKLAKRIEQINNVPLFGKILSYPTCCVEWFTQNQNNALNYDYDFFFLNVINSSKESYPFQNNIGVRYFDYSVLSHFPCSLNCEHSFKLANYYLEIIKNYNEQFYNEIVSELKKL